MKRNITALTFIAIGMIVFLANINAFQMGQLFSVWWPLLLLVAAGLMLINNKNNYIWPLFLAGLGVVFLLNNLNLTNISVGDVIVPALIITFGVSMLMHNNTKRQHFSTNDEDVTAILSGTESKNSSKDYKGGRLTAIMGGVELDLSHAVIEHEASLDVFVAMGGIELRVPENVVVKNRSTILLGGIEDKTRPVDTKKSPILYIGGTVIMGGVEVKR